MFTTLDRYVTDVKVRVGCSVEDLLKILELDREAETPLYERLNAVEGINSVDYDGHFGNALYFDVTHEFNSRAANWLEVERIVCEFLGQN